MSLRANWFLPTVHKGMYPCWWVGESWEPSLPALLPKNPPTNREVVGELALVKPKANMDPSLAGWRESLSSGI